MLYILNSSPYMCDITALLNIMQNGDHLLLLADGVIAGLQNSFFLQKLDKYKLNINIYAIINDLVARGFTNSFSKNIKIINYIDFVKLTEQHIHNISW